MKKKNKNKKLSTIIRILVGILIIVFFLKWINILESVKYLKSVDIVFFILACVVAIAIQLVRSLRYQVLVRIFNIKLDSLYNISVHFVSSITGSATPMRMGEGGKVFFYKNKRKTLGYCFLMEKITDTASLSTLGLLGLIFFRKFLPEFNIIFLIILAILGVIIGIVLLINIEKILRFIFKAKFPKKWFFKLSKQLLKNKKKFALTIVLSFSIWIVMALMYYFFLLSLGIQIGFIKLLLLLSMSLIIGMVSGIPGGYGVRELSFTAIISTYLGIDKSIVGLAAVIATLGGVSTIIIMSLISLWVIKKRKKFSHN